MKTNNKAGMNLSDISNLRLINQQIVRSKYKSAKDLVSWMGAIQAQDFNMSKWAVGLRLSNSTDKTIESAIDAGEIIRTHVMRPTWHFVSSDDIYWMLELTAPQIKNKLKSRTKELGLTETIFKKSNVIIEKALSGGNHLFRGELVAEVVRAGIRVDNNRASHLLLRAEVDGLICSGKIKANKQTYTLLPEWVLKTKALERNEALVNLAQRYFTSHGPATLQDFAWWSGLSLGESKQALEMIKTSLAHHIVGNQTYWSTNLSSIPKIDKDSMYLLPAFDEFIISYGDRKASLPHENHKKAVSDNGIFRPIIVVNGQVKGLWSRTIRKDKVFLQTEFFTHHKKPSIEMIKKACTAFGNFINKKVELRIAMGNYLTKIN